LSNGRESDVLDEITPILAGNISDFFDYIQNNCKFSGVKQNFIPALASSNLVVSRFS
jgi:hypothetical protein